MHKSVDRGRTWQASAGLAAGASYLVADPTDAATLYAGGRYALFKTSDGGSTWRALDNDLGIANVVELAISPAAPATIWVGTDSGFYVSRDAGATWATVGGGYPITVPGEAAVATLEIAADPVRARTVYASSSRGLYKTVDGGAHWSKILSTAPLTLAIDPLQPRKLYAAGLSFRGVLRSSDGGATWKPVSGEIGAHEVRALAIHPRSSAVYAAAAPSAPQPIYKSTDGGTTWTGAGRNLPATWVSAIAFDPTRPAAVYVASLAGIWKSGDRGRSWAPANRGIVATYVRAVALDPSQPRVVYAGADYAGVFKSTDRGQTWGARSSGPDADLIFALLVDATAPATVFAGTDVGVFRSGDAGATWSRFGPLTRVNGLAMAPAPIPILYAATDSGAWRSTDRGVTWSLAWPTGPSGDPTVRQIAVSPARPSDVYLTAPSGLFFSSDRGETWTQLPYAGTTPFSVAIDPLDPAVLYLSTGGPPLHKSVDGGQTWVVAASGLPAVSVSNLVIDPVRRNVLYATTWLGVYWSTDAAATWSRKGDGPTAPPAALALDSSGPSTLHAATFGGGVFEWTEVPPP